jgi:hypothetical protein
LRWGDQSKVLLMSGGALFLVLQKLMPVQETKATN